MSKLIDETGNCYGQLTVIKRAGSLGMGGEAAWLCKCRCGNETTVRGSSLRGGLTRSCGCLPQGRARLPRGRAAFNGLVAIMKRGAEKRGYAWHLSEEQVAILTQQQCYYCGTGPGQRRRNIGGNGDYVYNGIDRVDNSKGYTVDNVVPCCKACNLAKHTMTIDEFRSWAYRLYEHFVKDADSSSSQNKE